MKLNLKAKLKSNYQSKAQIGIDAIFSFLLFLVPVILIIVYINHSGLQSDLKNNQITEDLNFNNIKNKLELLMSDFVFSTPIYISNFTGTIPVNFYYNFSFNNFNPNLTFILDKNKNIIPVDIFGNNIFFIADAMKKPYFLITNKNNSCFDKTPLIYETDINTGMDFMNNSFLFLKFKNQGVESLKFNNKEILKNNGILLSTTSFDNIENTSIKASANFNNRQISVFSNNSLIQINSADNFNSVLYFINYAYFYNGDENIFNNTYSGNVWKGNIDFIDLYDDDEGVAIIGKDMQITINNNLDDFREIQITGINKYKIIPHNGNYKKYIDLSKQYINGINISFGATKQTKAMTNELVNKTFDNDYFDLKKQLGLSVHNININFSDLNASFGSNIPKNKDVFIYDYPVVFIDKFANKSIHLMKLAIWKGRK